MRWLVVYLAVLMMLAVGTPAQAVGYRLCTVGIRYASRYLTVTETRCTDGSHWFTVITPAGTVRTNGGNPQRW